MLFRIISFTIVLLYSQLSWAVAALDDLTVVATRLDNGVENLPNHTTVISAEELAKYPNHTLPEILELKAGLLIRSSFGNNAARSVIDIRGFGASGTQNTLILLDGKRLNDIDQSTINYSAIPVANIERIEIIRGAGSVLYGDGAVGGVINIISKRTASNTQSFAVSQRIASYDTWQTEGQASYGADNYSFNLFLNNILSDGYRDNNDLDQQNLQADFRYIFANTELFSKFGYSDQSLGLPGNRTVNPGTNLNELVNDRRGTNNPDDTADEEVAFATLGLRGSLFYRAEYIIDFGIRDKQQISDFVSQPRYIDTELQTLFFTPRFNLDVNTLDLNHDITFGVDLYHHQYDSDIANSQSVINQPIHVLDINQDSYAVYMNDLIQIDQLTHLNLGARYQYVKLKANDTFNSTAPGAAFDAEANDVERSDNAYSFNIGLKRRFSQSISAYMNWGQSVRIANVDDINQVSFPPPAFAAFREFTDLKPQRARHIDIGFDYSKKSFEMSLNFYHMSLRDEIHFNSSTFLNENLDPTKRKGIEFNLNYDVNDKLRAGFNYNLIRSTFTEGTFAGNDVPLVPKQTFQLLTEYNVSNNTTMIASWSYVGEKFFDNDQTNTFGQKIPSYSVVDLDLQHQWQNWKLGFSVKNLLDKKAFDSGVSSTFTPGVYNAFPLPERNFGLLLHYQF